MIADDRRRLFGELQRLVARMSLSEPTLMRSLETSHRLLEEAVGASWADQDDWLLRALGDVCAPPGPLAVGLLSLRLGLLEGLASADCLELAKAAFLGGVDPRRLAEERLRRPSGRSLGANVLVLLQCRAERLDGSGPLGLTGDELDAPVRLLAAASAFVDRIDRGGVRALASILSEPTHFAPQAAERLLQALSALPLGCYVSLGSGEKGRVVGTRPDEPLRPLISVRLRADGSVAEPAVLLDGPGVPVVTGILDDPGAGVPAPQETAQAWLRRVHEAGASRARGPRAALPAELTGDWGPPVARSEVLLREQERAESGGEAVRARERAIELEARSRRALLERFAEALESRRRLLSAPPEDAVDLLKQAVLEGRQHRLEAGALETGYEAALECLDIARAEIEALPYERRRDAVWNEKVGELQSRWDALVRRRAGSKRRQELDDEAHAEARKRLLLRVEKARNLRRRRIEWLRGRQEIAAAQAERARWELARLRGGEPGGPGSEDLPGLSEFAGSRPAGELEEQERRLAVVQSDIESFKSALAALADGEHRREEEGRAAFASMRLEAARELRRLRSESGLAELRRELAGLEEERDRRRQAEGEALFALEAERASRAERLAQVRRGAQAKKEAWAQERKALEASLLEKRRRLEELRGETLEAGQRRRELEARVRRAQADFEAKAAGLLARAGSAALARKASLEGALASLRSELEEAGSQRSEALLAFQQRRGVLEEELRRLRGEWGGLQGELAAQEAEGTPLRQALQKALSELDLRLLEALFALDTARKEALALSGDLERRLKDWAQAARELEDLEGRCAELSGQTEPLLERWRELAGQGLAGVSAVFREQILSRARELGLWSGRLAEVERRLAASRGALEDHVFTRCREAGLRAFREGRLDEARAHLRQALTLKADSEVRALLERLDPGQRRQP